MYIHVRSIHGLLQYHSSPTLHHFRDVLLCLDLFDGMTVENTWAAAGPRRGPFYAEPGKRHVFLVIPGNINHDFARGAAASSR